MTLWIATASRPLSFLKQIPALVGNPFEYENELDDDFKRVGPVAAEGSADFSDTDGDGWAGLHLLAAAGGGAELGSGDPFRRSNPPIVEDEGDTIMRLCKSFASSGVLGID
jgi:hypothetical protein